MAGTLAVIKKPEAYQVLAMEADNIRDVMETNLGDINAGTLFHDLDRIKLPGPDGTQWKMVDENPETFKGIILQAQTVRGHWPGDYVEGTPPRCSSLDGVFGLELETGNRVSCVGSQDEPKCEFAEWGSASTGSGQACKLMRRLFILRQERILPEVLSIPPTSLPSFRQYCVHLTSKGLKYRQVITTFRLAKTTTKSGRNCTIATFKETELLGPEDAAKVEKYLESIKGLLIAVPVTVDSDDYSVKDTEEKEGVPF